MDKKSFFQSKESVLKRNDNSSKGSWDKHILKLCNQINSLENYYTSSSCSGRIIIMVDQEKKGEGLFLFVSHDKVSFSQLEKQLQKILKNSKNKNIKFKTEAPILHVVCEDLISAQKLYDLAKLAGFKKSGIISSGRKFVLEINSGEKLEFPLIVKGKLLVDDTFLKVVLKNSNQKLQIGWKKINSLFNILSQEYF
jgi:tRNA wybutosine-synthesizing protein 3